MHITDWLEMLGEHFPLVVIGCAEALLAVVLLCAALRNRRQSTDKKRSALRRADEILPYNMDRQSNDVCLVMRQHDLLPICAAGDMQSLLGVTFEQLRQDVMLLADALEDGQKGVSVWKKYRAWDGTQPFEIVLRTKNGEWVQLNVTRGADDGYDLFCFSRTTGLCGRIEQYEERLAQSEEESRSKTTFLSRMSHEIRTPMNGIIGMLTLAENHLEPNAPAMQYLTKADELSDHMLALINDILDMSRIEAGKVELENKVFSLRELGDRLYDMFAKNLDSRGIRYEVSFDGVTVDYVLGDELRISQIIINFLSNAVKFTSEGEIIVTFRQMMLRNGVADMMIRVHDTGIGMEPAFISRIFRPFEQEIVETSRKYGGTGLGMAITDQLVKLMGGDIVVESQQSLIHRIPWGSRPRRAIISRASRAAAVRTIRMAAARLPRHQYRADPLRIPCRIRILERPAQVLLASRIRAASCIMKEMWMTAPYRRLLFSSRRIVRERQTRLRCTPGRKTSLPARFTMHWKPM